MAKKNKKLINKIEGMKKTDKYFMYINMPTYELDRTVSNMSECERNDFLGFCLAGLAAGIALDTQGTREEQEKAFVAILDMDTEQIMKLQVICAAIHPRTTKQLNDIIKNINSYVVTAGINSYYLLGMIWKTELVPHLSKGQRNPADVYGYENIGKKLCELNIAVLTPFGVLWTFENAQV